MPIETSVPGGTGGTAATGTALASITDAGKSHFEVLDGLRGSAAFLIVVFHAFNYTFDFQGPWALVPHAYLAVDFFFALSGFVIGYAYDERWPALTTRRFLALRLIRLHPMVVVGASLGLAVYLLDPHAPASNHTPASMLLLAYLTSLLLLPSPPVGGRPDESQALNGPAWSLTQEYLGNLAYVLALRRLRASGLAAVFVIAGAGLAWAACRMGSLEGGWDYPKMWMAPLRLATSFVLGLWLYRIRGCIRLPRLGMLPLSLLLLACFQAPALIGLGNGVAGGLYDAACVLLLFPVIVLCGAHSQVGARMLAACRLAGRLSYPLYATHIGLVYMLAHFARQHGPAGPAQLPAVVATIVAALIVAWLLLVYVDEPVRAWLKRRLGAPGRSHISQNRSGFWLRFDLAADCVPY